MSMFGSMNRRKKIGELIESWIEYRDMVSRHAAQGTATPEQERQFLNLKAKISAQLPLMDQMAGHGSQHAEATMHLRGMTELMNSQLTLTKESDAAAGDDFLGRWHTHFLYLNRFKGQEATIASAPRRMGAAAPISGKAGPGINRVHHLFNNWFTRLVVQVALLAAVVIVATKVFDINWSEAPAWGRRVASEWWGPSPTRPAGEAASRARGAAAQHDAATQKSIAESANPGTAPKPATGGRAVVINGGEGRPRHSVDNTGAFLPPIGPNPVRRFADKLAPMVPRPVRSFFEPVAQYWGVEATVVLIGIGMLLFAYMIFGRAR